MTSTPYRSRGEPERAPARERAFPKREKSFAGGGVAFFLPLAVAGTVVLGLVEEGVGLAVSISVAFPVCLLALAIAARGALRIWDELFAPPVTLGETGVLVPRQVWHHLRHLTLGYGEITQVEHWGGRGAAGGVRLHHAGGKRNVARSDYWPHEWDFLIRLLRRAYAKGRLDAKHLFPAPLITVELVRQTFEIPQGVDPRPAVEFCYERQLAGTFETLEDGLALARSKLEDQQ